MNKVEKQEFVDNNSDMYWNTSLIKHMSVIDIKFSDIEQDSELENMLQLDSIGMSSMPVFTNGRIFVVYNNGSCQECFEVTHIEETKSIIDYNSTHRVNFLYIRFDGGYEFVIKESQKLGDSYNPVLYYGNDELEQYNKIK